MSSKKLGRYFAMYFSVPSVSYMLSKHIRNGDLEAKRVGYFFKVSGESIYNLLLCSGSHSSIDEAREDSSWVHLTEELFLYIVDTFIKNKGLSYVRFDDDVEKDIKLVESNGNNSKDKNYSGIPISQIPPNGVPFLEDDRHTFFIYRDGSIIKRTLKKPRGKKNSYFSYFKIRGVGDLIRVSCGGVAHHFSKAKLLLENFTDYEPKKFVVFKDGNPENYSLDNLKYSDHKYKIKNAVDNRARFGKEPKPVILTHILDDTVVEFDSALDAAGFLNTGVGNVCNCCNGKVPSVRGYVASYKEKEEEK